MNVKSIDDKLKYGLLVLSGFLVIAGVAFKPLTYLALVIVVFITLFSVDSK